MPKGPHKKKYKSYTPKLRNHSTPGEISLWCEVLRARKFYGYQFNRQIPIGRYTADFVCDQLQLVIAIDGKSPDEKQEEERRKDEFMRRQGYRVLRLSEHEIRNDLLHIIQLLENYLPEDKQEED